MRIVMSIIGQLFMHTGRSATHHHRSIALLIFLCSLVFGFISISKHNHFQTYAWDLAFFDELIWKVSQGIEPRSSFNNLHILGDHFQPIIFLFTPLYWIKSDVRLLLIAHAFVASISVLPIYLLSQRLIKHTVLSLAVSLNYLLFTGYQHAVLDGFHQSVLAPFFLGWLYYGLETKKKWLYWFSAFGLLLTKEEYALLLSAIGIMIVFYYKRPKLGTLTFFTGIVSFFFLVYVAIPYFQKGSYTHFGYGELGITPQQVLITSLTQPQKLITLLISPSVKLATVFSTFFSFGFLPLLSPWHLLPVMQQFIVRFVDTVTVHRWTNLNHYSFPLSPLMTVATIYGLKKLLRKKRSAFWLCCYIVIFSLLQNLVYHGPINSLFKPQFYETQSWEIDARKLIEQVPPRVTIASQNSLLPHLSERPKFYLLPEIREAEYVAVDLTDGPNKFSPLDHQRTKALIDQLLAEKKYEVIWQAGESALLKSVLPLK